MTEKAKELFDAAKARALDLLTVRENLTDLLKTNILFIVNSAVDALGSGKTAPDAILIVAREFARKLPIGDIPGNIKAKKQMT